MFFSSCEFTRRSLLQCDWARDDSEEEEDARAAMEVTKPSAVLHLSRYEDWCAQFGDHRH